MIPVCIILVALVLVVGLAATLLAAALDRARRQLATTEQRRVETATALDRQRTLLSSTEARLAETSASLAEVTVKYNEAHRGCQLLLAEAGAHRAVEMAAKILEYVRPASERHIRLVLEGNSDDAWSSATTDLAKAECVATCAVVGDFDRALKLLAELVRERQEGALMVICVESYRRDDRRMGTIIFERLLAVRPGDCWMWIHLASGYLGRVPWAGYPFPDS